MPLTFPSEFIVYWTQSFVSLDSVGRMLIINIHLKFDEVNPLDIGSTMNI